jgi:SAM-dependent methyltransferase
MDAVFSDLYAQLYDSFYHDKDYEVECDLLEEVFRRYAQGPVGTILDLGCGTGNHAFPLARRGYRVTGVDRSPEMLALAQEKLANFSDGPDRQPPVFHLGDIRDLDLGEQFDAVLMMFAVLGYQLTNEDVLAALGTVRRHLKPGGLLVADVWYGPAVLAQRPSDRIKVISTAEGQIIRTASATLDTFLHLVEVRYHLWHLEGARMLQETQETHQVRYFFPQELSLFMNKTLLSIKNISAFGQLNTLASESTWNAMIIATLQDEKVT